MAATTPSSSKSTQRVTAGWTAEESAKMDKYLRKEAAGDVVPPEKWERSFPRHSKSSIKAKRRHRIADFQKAGISIHPSKSSGKESSSSQVQRNLFNSVLSGLAGPSSSSSSSSSEGLIKDFIRFLLIFFIKIFKVAPLCFWNLRSLKLQL